MNTHSLLLIKTIIVVTTLFLSTYTLANENAELKKAAEAACGKIKMCIKKQASEAQDMSPEMVRMIDEIAETSCKSLYQINDLTADDNLVEPIIKCYEAMAKSACSDLEDGAQPQACLDLEKEVENL